MPNARGGKGPKTKKQKRKGKKGAKDAGWGEGEFDEWHSQAMGACRAAAARGSECSVSGAEGGARGGSQTTPEGPTACEPLGNSVPVTNGADCSSVFDLHSHSHYSDGLLSPAQLVRRAARNGVRALALTDHDSLQGLQEARDQGLKCGVVLIPATEVSCTVRMSEFLSVPVHILAYFGPNGPSDNGQLEDCLAALRERRHGRIHALIRGLTTRGIHLDASDILKAAHPSTAPGRMHVAKALVDKGHASSYRDAFTRFLSDEQMADAGGWEADAVLALTLIRQAGGLSALAHPWSIKGCSIPALLRVLQGAGLAGLEVVRWPNRASEYSDLANQFGLLKLGGSDFHAKAEKGETDLGGCSLPLKHFKLFLSWRNESWWSPAPGLSQQRTFVNDESSLDSGSEKVCTEAA